MSDNDVSVIVVDDFDGDVIYVSPPKAKSACKEVRETIDEELGITFSRAGINLPHAREHCKFNKFIVKAGSNSQVLENKTICEKCYCFVCDDLASECKLWTTGDYPHCNAFAKNVTWERMRASHKEANTFQTLRKRNPKRFLLCSTSADALTIKTSEELKKCDKQIALIFASARCDCKCYCHRQTGVTVPLRCSPCVTNHIVQIQQWSSHEERLNNEILSAVKTAMKSTYEYLAKRDLESACVILEGLTRIFFSLHLPWQVDSSEVVYNAITLTLKKAWIDIFILPSLSTPLYQFIKDALSELLTQATKAQSFPLKNILCLRSVFNIKRWRNSALQQVVAGNSSACNFEDVDVAAARLECIISNSLRFKKDAINYLQGTKVKMLPDWQVPKEPLYDLPMNVLNVQRNDQRMVDIPIFRRRWIKLNTLTNSLDNVVRVSVIPYRFSLQGQPSGTASSRQEPCPVKDFTLDDLRDIIPFIKTARGDIDFLLYTVTNTQSFLFMMHALQVNASLRAEENMDQILQSLCPRGYEKNWLTSSNVLFPMRACAYQTLEELKNPAKVVNRDSLNKEAVQYLQAIRIERFVQEIVIAFACTYFNDNLDVLNKLIKVLEEKEALYACEGVFKSPKLADLVEWDDPVELFITKSSSFPVSSDHIPRRFFESWFKRIQPDTTSTLKAVNLLQILINEKSSKEAGQEFPILLVNLFLDRVEVTQGAVGALETLIIKFVPLIKDPAVAQVLKQKIQRLNQATTPPIQPEPEPETKTKGTGSKSSVTKDDKDELMEWLLIEDDEEQVMDMDGDDIQDVIMDDAEAIIECSTSVDENHEKRPEGSAAKPQTASEKTTPVENKEQSLESAKEKSPDLHSRKNKKKEKKKKDKKKSPEDEWFSELVRKGKFDELEKELNSSVSSDIHGKRFLSQITSIVQTLPQPMQRLLFRSCSDRLAVIMYNQVFDDWQHEKFSSALITCLDTINKSHPAIFRLILFKTMNKAEEAIANHRIGSDRRTVIVRWMIDVKNLCARLGTSEIWHKEFSRLLAGSTLRKKKALYSTLVSCEQLTRESSVQGKEPTIISD